MTFLALMVATLGNGTCALFEALSGTNLIYFVSFDYLQVNKIHLSVSFELRPFITVTTGSICPHAALRFKGHCSLFLASCMSTAQQQL